MENIEEAWLPAAEAELTALAAEAEKVERMPDTLLLRPPPPGGVDLITPDPRYTRKRALLACYVYDIWVVQCLACLADCECSSSTRISPL